MYVDANLLVLLVVGIFDRGLVGRHRRTRQFRAEDYDLLSHVVANVGTILVTPNTLTEASNLLGYHSEPQRGQLMKTLRALLDDVEESFVPSKVAARQDAFPRLGLTDAGLLESISERKPLLTADADLYVTALGKNSKAAVNFHHLRGL